MKHILLVLASLAALGCGSGADISGNAELQNGVVNGTVSVQTPLGTFTYPSKPAPSVAP